MSSRFGNSGTDHILTEWRNAASEIRSNEARVEKFKAQIELVRFPSVVTLLLFLILSPPPRNTREKFSTCGRIGRLRSGIGRLMLRSLFGNSRISDYSCTLKTKAKIIPTTDTNHEHAFNRRTLQHWRNVREKYAKQMVTADTARFLDDESEYRLASTLSRY